MSKANNQHYNTRHQMDAPKEKKRKLPDPLKILLFLFLTLPIISLAGYLTGFWTIRVEEGKMVSDGIDYFVKYFIVTSGAFGIVLLWFSLYWLEGD